MIRSQERGALVIVGDDRLDRLLNSEHLGQRWLGITALSHCSLHMEGEVA